MADLRTGAEKEWDKLHVEFPHLNNRDRIVFMEGFGRGKREGYNDALVELREGRN